MRLTKIIYGGSRPIENTVIDMYDKKWLVKNVKVLVSTPFTYEIELWEHAGE
jgi:hypothetical protein